MPTKSQAQKLYEARFRKLFVVLARWGYDPLQLARLERFLVTAEAWCRGDCREPELKDVLESIAVFHEEAAREGADSTTIGDFRAMLSATKRDLLQGD